MSEEDFAKKVQKYFDKKDYKTALKIVNQDGKKFPDNPYVLYGRGYALFHLKKYKKALDAFKEYVANKRANLGLGYCFLAECYKELENYKEAIPNFKKSLEYKPKFEKSLFGLEYCYRMLNDLDNAIDANLSITQIYPTRSQPWYWLSVIHLVKENLTKAYSYVLRALRNAKKDKEVWGLYKEIQDRYEELEKPEAVIDALKEIAFSGDLAYGKIDLNDRGIKSLDQIENLDITRLNLFHLFLNQNEIEDISSLNGFPELGYLELSDNKITSLKNFGNLPKLNSLRLDGNIIQKINGLFDLPKLTYLDLSDNEITKIEGLHVLKLKTLNLSNNQIQVVEGLEQQNKLSHLYLSNNLITDIYNLRSLSSLEFLYLSNNKISSLQGLESLSKLRVVYLDNNPNLPEVLAKVHSGPEEIGILRQLCRFSSKELLQRSEEIYAKIREQEIEKQKRKAERLERLFIEEKKRIERDVQSILAQTLSTYGVKQKLHSRMQALLSSAKEGSCSYCNNSVSKDRHYAVQCADAIDNMIEETVKSLPSMGKDRYSYTDIKETYEVTNRRMDIYDRPGTTWVTRVKRVYGTTKIHYYNSEHFPKLQGIVCKNCNSSFIRKASRIFNRLKRRRLKDKHFSDTIQKQARNCHENYLKLYESMLEKRGF
ncbi:MAG: leucine-rich repeat protein [Asgard group archaeon]|nr:leucine-rich repeat protein [Asgard group archaeon]